MASVFTRYTTCVYGRDKLYHYSALKVIIYNIILTFGIILNTKISE